jgi:hypothetical protein
MTKVLLLRAGGFVGTLARDFFRGVIQANEHDATVSV